MVFINIFSFSLITVPIAMTAVYALYSSYQYASYDHYMKWSFTDNRECHNCFSYWQLWGIKENKFLTCSGDSKQSSQSNMLAVFICTSEGYSIKCFDIDMRTISATVEPEWYCSAGTLYWYFQS
jgi:uncharacterized membrane protein YwzB